MDITTIIVIVISVLLALSFFMAGGMKLVNTKQSLLLQEHFHLAPWFVTLTGVLEVLGALGLIVGIFWHPLAAAAALGLAGVMVGAAGSHLTHGDGVSKASAPVVLFALAVVVVVLRWGALAAFLGH